MKQVLTLLVILCLAAWATAGEVRSENTEARVQRTAAVDRQSMVLGHQSPVIGTEAITIPLMLSYQGKLTDTLGQPVADSTYRVSFRLYTVSSGGSPFWDETQTVTTKAGLFSVLLGSVTPIGSLPDAGALYLGMAVSGSTELTPRLRVASAAYAFLSSRAANADLLQGKDTTALDARYVNEAEASSVTSNMIVDGTVAAVDLNQMGASSGQVMKWNGSTWVPGNDSVGQSSDGTVTSVGQTTGVVCNPNPITSTGTVGLDTTYSDGRYVKNQFVVNQAASWRITGQGWDSMATGGSGNAALYGIATGSNYGVWGKGDSYPGVYGTSASAMRGAVEGNNSSSSGGSGVIGYGGAAIGVNGISTSNFGVRGQSSSNYGAYDSSGSSCGAYCVGAAGGVYGRSSASPGVRGVDSSTTSGAVEGHNNASAGGGYGVGGFGDAAIGVCGVSTSNIGVKGVSSSGCGAYDSSGWCGVYAVGDYGLIGRATGFSGVLGSTQSSSFPAVQGVSSTYWGTMGHRSGRKTGSGYEFNGALGGLLGATSWGDTFAFGTAGYTSDDRVRTGGVIGSEWFANCWGALGYKNSSGNWYAGYGTSDWTSGSGLGNHAATGIGCGYGGGLMGGWLKGKCYGATVSGDRYAIYTKGNNYTTGYSAVMQNTGDKREASYVPTSTTVDVYTSGVSEMKGGQATVSFPASFASIVSKDVPVVVTATPMGPFPLYLSSSDNKGFAVAAVDAKMAGSVKFAWIAVGRRAGYEQNPEVPAELCRTDFDSKMDAAMFNENDLHHSAQPVWFDGTRLRFDSPPEEPRPPTPVVPASGVMPSTAPIPNTTTAPTLRPSTTQSTGVGR